MGDKLRREGNNNTQIALTWEKDNVGIETPTGKELLEDSRDHSLRVYEMAEFTK